jgi:hypothetical protein
MRNLAIFTILLSLVACGGGKSSQNATSAPAASQAAGSESSGGSMGSMNGSSATIPNCGAVKAVWVNLNSHVYHEPGDPYYGKTKHGEYLCPNQAKAQGFHKAGEKAAAHS